MKSHKKWYLYEVQLPLEEVGVAVAAVGVSVFSKFDPEMGMGWELGMGMGFSDAVAVTRKFSVCSAFRRVLINLMTQFVMKNVAGS